MKDNIRLRGPCRPRARPEPRLLAASGRRWSFSPFSSAYSFVQRWNDGETARDLDARARRSRMCGASSRLSTRSRRFCSLPGTISAWYEASIYLAGVRLYPKLEDRHRRASSRKAICSRSWTRPNWTNRSRRRRRRSDRAEAALDLAKVTADRWTALRQSSAVSKQSADEEAADSTGQAGRSRGGEGRSRTAQGAESLRSDRRALRWRRHRPQHRHRLLCRAGARARKAAVQGCRYSRRAPLCRGSSGLFREPHQGYEGGFHDAAMERSRVRGEIATTSNAIGATTGSLLVEVDAPNPDGACSPAPMPTRISNCRSIPTNCAFHRARFRSARTTPASPRSTATAGSSSRMSSSPRILARKS